ncbi:hypothetical protein [Pedobacter steynii]|nr:hypothetical protein [Pedobacter steynii]
MDLIGRVAIVDPYQDAMQLLRPGECCVIQDIRSELPCERVYVAFEDGKVDYFHPTDLLILRPRSDILRSIVTSTANMNKDDYKNLIKVLKLQTDKKTVLALQLAVSKECYFIHCITSCQDWVAMKETQRLKQFKQSGKRI